MAIDCVLRTCPNSDLQLTDCRKAGPDVLLLILQPTSRKDGGDRPAQDDSPAS